MPYKNSSVENKQGGVRPTIYVDRQFVISTRISWLPDISAVYCLLISEHALVSYRIVSYRLTVIWWVPHMEQKLLTLHGHQSSSRFLWGGIRVAQSSVFCIVVYTSWLSSRPSFVSLVCLSFFESRLLISLLVSSKFS